MIFEGFKIHSFERIHEAYCTNSKCKNKRKSELMEVSNGFLSTALFCPTCKSVYLLKLERQTKVNKEFLQQCMDEVEMENRKRILIGEIVLEREKRRTDERDKRNRSSKTKK